jgi:hypothetical protein
MLLQFATKPFTVPTNTNIVHGADLSDEWFTALVNAGVTFTATPENELGHGHCVPITWQLPRLGAAPSLSTDTETAVSGEILSAARIALRNSEALTTRTIDKGRSSPAGMRYRGRPSREQEPSAWLTGSAD